MNDSDKFTVKLFDDEDGFYGPEGPNGIDHDAVYTDYCNQVTDQIHQWYPNAIVEFEYGPYSGRSIILSDVPDTWAGDDEDSAGGWIGEAIERVYNRGTFWTA